jgi:hypothetical protein
LDVFGGLNVGRRDGRREILVLVLLFYGNGWKAPRGLGVPRRVVYRVRFTSVPRGTDVGVRWHNRTSRGLFRCPNLPPNLLCRIPIPHHIKMPAHV